MSAMNPSLEGRWQPVYAELGGAQPQNFSTQGDKPLYLVNYQRK